MSAEGVVAANAEVTKVSPYFPNTNYIFTVN